MRKLSPVALLMGCLAAHAEDPLPVMDALDTGVEAEAAPAKDQWPVTAVLDPGAKVLRLQWAAGEAEPEEIPFEDVVRLERARPYEGLPDELLALLADGRRVLLSHGADVATHAALAPAMTSLPYKVLASGEGHVVTPSSTSRPPPRFAIGKGEGFAITSAATGSLQSLESTTTDTVRHLLTPIDEARLDREGGGELKRAEIELGIKQGLEGVRACYERQLQRDPTLAGKVTVSFVIDVDGTVKFAALKNSSLNHPVAEACIAEHVGTLRFVKPRGGRSVVVSYPFKLTPR